MSKSAVIRAAIRLAAAVVLLLLATANAGAIPAFARRYGVSCRQCHNPVPKLTEFGEMFAAHGFRMASGEAPVDTLPTDDELLALAKSLPLAIRFDAFMQLYGNGESKTDFQTPYGIKLLSSAPISSNISFYFYFFLYERGEVGGIEDAFVHVNDLGGRPVDLVAGQFQVSDPLFKRELRLEFEDYSIYRARIGLQPADLTYDRGLYVAADAGGFTLSAELVNGNGKDPAGDNLHFDDDAPKNIFGHLTRDLVPGRLRLGVMAYAGQKDGAVGGAPAVRGELWMAGADGTIGHGPVELNLQYVHREDVRPTFTPGEPDAVTDGGFAELIWLPAEGRWYGFGLYNYIECDQPLLDPRNGGPSGLTRFQTLAGGAGYVVRRNFRVQLEAGWDLEQETSRVTVGMTAAY